MKESRPEFRVVGGAPEKAKEKVREELLEKLFGEKHLANLPEKSKLELEKLEYAKIPEQLELIRLANKRSSELMEIAGVTPYDVPERNLHIIPPELYEKTTGGGGTATTYQKEQNILINAAEVQNNLVYFGKVAFHELLHLKSHFTVELEEQTVDGTKREKTTPFREGLTARAAQKRGYSGYYHEHFWGLTEAVIAHAEHGYTEEMMKLSMLEKERVWMESAEALKIKTAVAQEKELRPEDLLWVRPDSKDYAFTGYRRQREVLRVVMGEIQKEFPDTYASPDEVYQEFLRSLFTGRMLPLARLVEKTFGEGSFRVLGMMSDDKETPIQVLEYLRKARLRQAGKRR